MIRSFALALAATVITLTSPALSQTAQPIKVVASFSIIADLARNVGGDRVKITTLVGPDGDAHVYEPSPADAATVAGADIMLVNGLGLEGFLPRLIEASASKATIVELSKGASLQASAEADHDDHDGKEEHGHDHGAFDPHAWQSIPNAEIYVTNIADALCGADAAGCDTYRANTDAYRAKLKSVDADVRAAVASIPENRRTIITSHDAFGYFHKEYGMTFLAPEGISTEAEASAADVAALVRQVREDNASAIFVENISDPRLAEQIVSETGLQLGGALYSDALSGPDGPAATYIDMMRYNIKTIRAAIVGS